MIDKIPIDCDIEFLQNFSIKPIKHQYFPVREDLRDTISVNSAVFSDHYNFSKPSARRTKETRMVLAVQTKITIFLTLSLPAVSLLTSRLRVGCYIFYLCLKCDALSMLRHRSFRKHLVT